jgi:hypothetical protein
MGYIKEPTGVTFIVDPKPLTIKDKEKISAIISNYKKTGRKKINTIAKKKALV